VIEDGKDHGFEARTFMDLQCPHQGAKNLINAARFLISLSQLSGVSSVAPVAADVNRKRAMMFAQVSRPRAVPITCLSSRSVFEQITSFWIEALLEQKQCASVNSDLAGFYSLLHGARPSRAIPHRDDPSSRQAAL
jgi:hypothetical protein